jgi:hypothetical protein
MSLPFHFARSITTTFTPLERNASGGQSGVLTRSRLRATFGNVAASAIIPRPSNRTERTDPTSIHQNGPVSELGPTTNTPDPVDGGDPDP